MENELLYLSGNDIPFIEAKVIIHQPTIKEIAYIGEKSFFTGCQFLNFSTIAFACGPPGLYLDELLF